MTTFTSRGVPMVEATDPADIAARVNPVAQLAHDRPGVSALTTTQRNALAGAELWDGRVILNTTTDRINRYDLGTTTWIEIADTSQIAALLASAGTATNVGPTASRGVSGSAARADHVHIGAATQVHNPTVTSETGIFTTVSAVTRYNDDGVLVQCRSVITITTAGTAGGELRITLPVAARDVAGTSIHMGSGRDPVSGFTVAVIRGGSTLAGIQREAGGSIIASGRVVHLEYTYEK